MPHVRAMWSASLKFISLAVPSALSIWEMEKIVFGTRLFPSSSEKLCQISALDGFHIIGIAVHLKKIELISQVIKADNEKHELTSPWQLRATWSLILHHVKTSKYFVVLKLFCVINNNL
jgi:hypothetical protein